MTRNTLIISMYSLFGYLLAVFPVSVSFAIEMNRGDSIWISAPDRSGGAGNVAYPHPQQLFSTLHVLAPNIRRVIVVLDPKRFGWIVKPATEAASSEKIELVVHEARTLSEGATLLWKSLLNGNKETDSIWLLEGDQFSTPIVFRYLIEQSASKNMIVFSTLPEHVKQGVLFALYQDPMERGKLLKAVNLHAASFISLNISPEVTGHFDVVLGEH